MSTRTIIALTCCMVFAATGIHAQERIAVSGDNPHYWSYQGSPVLLLGGSDEDNLFNHPDLMMRNLETLARIGGNYIRCTMSSRDEGDIWAYEQTAGGCYDLDRFNTEYWERLETCVREAARRDIIVQIEIWATFDFYRDIWPLNPFNPAANVNYTTENTRLVPEWPHHPASNPQPFFYSVPDVNDDRVLLAYQQAFVRQVLDTTLPYGNVLYCLDNETRAPAEWALYWGGFIRDEAAERGVTVMLTEMWDQWDITAEEHHTTWGNPELFAFTDVSQNNWQEGQTHYDRLLWYRNNLAENGVVRPMNNIKVYARRGGGLDNDTAISVDRWWRNIFAGCASTRFHRPTGGIGLDDAAQRHIRAARAFTSAFNIFACEPRPDLLSGRSENEAYCLADPGSTYAVYFPSGGEIDLEVYRGVTYRVRWVDTATASFTAATADDVAALLSDAVHGQRQRLRLRTPGEGAPWLALVEGAE